ncbi:MULTISPECIES: ABC transporter ATP-binding protein [unclassified Knoellia]|uniref:ABC transporter ATP-binding protein n=1 Tax=Knoellia altitudinis TaxID=3404795 RepID=UPI00360EDCC1
MVEAAFLVLVTGLLLALTSGRDVIGPVAGQELPIDAALVAAAIGLVLRFALNMLALRQSAALSAAVRTNQRRRLAHAYLGAAWSVHQQEPSGRLQELLTSFISRVLVAVAAAIQGLTSALSVVAFLGAGLVIQPLATLAVLAFLAVLAALLGPLRSAIRRAAIRSSSADLDFATSVAELGALGREMQIFGARPAFLARVDALTAVATEHQRRVQVLFGSLAPTYTLFSYGAVLLAVTALSLIDVDDLTTVGAVTLLMLRSLTYGQQLVSVHGTVVSSLPALEEVEETARRYESQPAAGGVVTPRDVMPLVLMDAGFSYDESRPTLSGVDLAIDRGEILGVIGPSGAGKSTLAQLLLGLRTPGSGHLTVGGVPLTEVDRTWWTKHVSFVPQDPALFTGTVAENIRFFRDGIDDEAVHRAADQANVLSDVKALPQGFDTHLGERGGGLSGGQRQRLSIARALAGSPSLLILDEPTSALDGHSESLIRDTIIGLRGRVTVVVIAHRMSTIDMCDRIMVVEGGRVTALGAPAQLQASSTFYRRALSTAGILSADVETSPALTTATGLDGANSEDDQPAEVGRRTT